MRIVSVGMILGIWAGKAQAQTAKGNPVPLKLADPFTDHAVLQRDKPIHIWGEASPKRQVGIDLASTHITAIADANGHWKADLPAMTAGGPYTLSVSDAQTRLSLSDILVGDVFLCSGQSNMEFSYKLSSGSWGGRDLKVEPNIRIFNIRHDSSEKPLANLSHPAQWQIAGPGVTDEYSAVCYQMSRKIAESQKVPVGMIDSYWGGTPIQTWMSEEALKSVPNYESGLKQLNAHAKDPTGTESRWLESQKSAWLLTEPDISAAKTWQKPDFDDHLWPKISPNGPWEEAGIADLANYDGIVWMRLHLNLDTTQAGQSATIQLGPIDDIDDTWINGALIGHGSTWDMPRSYFIPKGVLKAGDNVLVIRVLDNGGGGGPWGRAEDRKIMFHDGTQIILPRQFTYHIAGNPKTADQSAQAPWQAPNGLTLLYNAMIAPVTPYGLKGIAWYQGETNAKNPVEYQYLLTAWMKDWRTRFQSPDLNFLIVQLTAFGPASTQPNDSNWAQLRESQRLAVAADPHAGMAVIIDYGDRSDIHPTQKSIVGQRLARLADRLIYGYGDAEGDPVPVSVRPDGLDLIIDFKYAARGLKTYSSDTAIGFEACAGKACHYVTAQAEGHTIRLKDAYKPAVTKVRYGWSDAPFLNLFSADDLPVGPFEMTLSTQGITPSPH